MKDFPATCNMNKFLTEALEGSGGLQVLLGRALKRKAMKMSMRYLKQTNKIVIT